jgi:translation elongation factor EF-Ts
MNESKIVATKRLQSEGLWNEASLYREEVREHLRGEGMRNFLESQGVLSEQTYVKDDSQSVGKFAASKEMKLLQFVRWELGDDAEESNSAGSEDAGE